MDNREEMANPEEDHGRDVALGGASAGSGHDARHGPGAGAGDGGDRNQPGDGNEEGSKTSSSPTFVAAPTSTNGAIEDNSSRSSGAGSRGEPQKQTAQPTQ